MALQQDPLLIVEQLVHPLVRVAEREVGPPLLRQPRPVRERDSRAAAGRKVDPLLDVVLGKWQRNGDPSGARGR